jgi:hypothetical protein
MSSIIREVWSNEPGILAVASPVLVLWPIDLPLGVFMRPQCAASSAKDI